MEQPVLHRIEDGVGIITFNRPERMNAMNREGGELFEAIIAELGSNPEVRVLVITGTGERAFCVGADVERLQDMIDNNAEGMRSRRKVGDPTPLDVFADAPQGARIRYASPIAVPKPVIAAVNGAVAGAGFSLAVACDMRFASSTAVFAGGFSRRGLSAEAGVAWTLPRLVGRGAAADILLSGRKIDAHEALRIGLVNAIHAPENLLDRTLAYARDMAENASPRSLAVIKRQLQVGYEQDFDAAAKLAEVETVASLQTEDFREGVASLKEKRTPRFTGR
jgi:enoyl-CoA hydratase/carnithine racemase